MTLVSVVISCYNQARFLAEAIESVLTQTYRDYEIILVDDGSTDHTAKVGTLYPRVKYIYQKNQGLAAARNAGWRASQGDFVVFVDADDRLLSDTLSAGIRCLQEHPECAFVWGHFRYIKSDGTLLNEFSQIRIDQDHYKTFLQGNYISMHATVMYRRTVLERVGGFDTSLRACEDYDLYLRITRNHPVCRHEAVVAEYRQHDANMSGDAALMLRAAVDVLRSQESFVASERPLWQAFRSGLRSWTIYYGKPVIWQFFRLCMLGDGKGAFRAISTLFHHVPYYFQGR